MRVEKPDDIACPDRLLQSCSLPGLRGRSAGNYLASVLSIKSRVVQAVFHSTLVMGASASSFLDRHTVLAQNVAFICGLILLIASLWIGSHFLRRQTHASRLLPTFSFALVLFGICGCWAVAIGRAYLLRRVLNSRYTLYPSSVSWGVFFTSPVRRFFAGQHVVVCGGRLFAHHCQGKPVGFYRPRFIGR